ELVRQATLLRTDAAKLGDRVVDVADKHLSRISDTVGPFMADTRVLVGSLDHVVNDTRPAIQTFGLMTGDLRTAIQPQLVCAGNGGCWPSQVTGILGGVKTGLGEGALTMRSWRQATPDIAANIAGITGNANKLSKPRWYTKLATIAAPIVGGIVAARVAK
ncbi:MAG TPA: hypothetical protein VGH38_00145, partial [Bryobacteraceae bacterium]